ncbi:MAG: ATP-binding protein [Treponema sp. CETP13]|nr:MAG: ATP-binding protein [Treponema sp. CETP13]
MQIIPVASGKGGVGKSLLSANIAITLGKYGKDVILADLDLGASNLHLAIGQQAPKKGIGTYLSGQSEFKDIILPTDYRNVRFIAGDAEIPGLTSLKLKEKQDLIHNLQSCDADFLIIDLGAGTHTTILDMFLLSPRGILVTAPAVTATLNGYLFLKSAVFRLMNNSFPKESGGYKYLENLRKQANSLQRLYIPKLTETLQQIDPEHTNLFRKRMKQFKPRLILNMIENPDEASKAQKIRHSCTEYLGIEMEHLGVVYRDPMQDIALASRLPITIYKPQSILSQAVFRITDKLIEDGEMQFDEDGLPLDSFKVIENEAIEDYESKMSYIQDLIGSGAITTSELADTIKAQYYEITQLKKENLLLKSKIVNAANQGYKL